MEEGSERQPSSASHFSVVFLSILPFAMVAIQARRSSWLIRPLPNRRPSRTSRRTLSRKSAQGRATHRLKVCSAKSSSPFRQANRQIKRGGSDGRVRAGNWYNRSENQGLPLISPDRG